MPRPDRSQAQRTASGAAARAAAARRPRSGRAASPGERAPVDELLSAIADYALGYECRSEQAYDTAFLCLMDALGCGFRALRHPACTRLLGPIVPGAALHGGARVPGTGYELDPVSAAFNIGAMVRWLDFNDTFLAAEWGHPSDNLGGLLASADYLARAAALEGHAPLCGRDLLSALIKAYEIQGVLSLKNSFNRVGLDHVLLVRVACAAVCAALLGGTREELINALSNAWLDGGALRAYRHAPNAGSRKSWAAGDAASRGVWHALLARRGEMGYPQALSARTWGFHDAVLRGRRLALPQPFGSYVIEHVMFKLHPAEFHAQTAVEAALRLHPAVAGRLDQIERVRIETQESAARIIDKTGPLSNPADRDHCLQYMVAVALIFGRLEERDYEREVAADPRIDALRAKMRVSVRPKFSRDYLAPARRYVGNAVQVLFRGGGSTERIAIDCPLGHPRRRSESLPQLQRKFEAGVAGHFGAEQARSIVRLFSERARLEALPVNELMAALVLA